LVVVPFRLGSSRFPGKALSIFRGATLLETAVRNASVLSDGPVVVTGPAADIHEAKRAVCWEPYRLQWIPSSERCACATDRVLEIFAGLPAERFLSLPVDEPALDASELRRAIASAEPLPQHHAVTFYCDFFEEQDYLSPLSAKLVLTAADMLLYMSRAVVPVRKGGSVDPAALKKNVGAFVFPRPFLQRLADQRHVPTSLDTIEGLEQLRWLELGLGVLCLKVRHVGFGIDVPEQAELLEARLKTIEAARGRHEPDHA